jgi:hypothetical protein
MKMRCCLMLAAMASLTIAETAAAQELTKKGPSTNTEPYVVPTIQDGRVKTVSILTTGEKVPGKVVGTEYRMAGVPDGLGAFYDSVGGTGNEFNLVAHHELGAVGGVKRSHGSTGAFVSRWRIDRTETVNKFKVVSGRDEINGPSDLFTWNGTGYVSGQTTAFERFCSADMAQYTAFYSKVQGLGTLNRIFLGGEETDARFSPDYGRAWAHVASGPNAGKTYQLPRMGKHAFENAVASPFAQPKTIVMIGDDSSNVTGITLENLCTAPGCTGVKGNIPSELFMYVGMKQSTGNEIERAGLTNGNLYGMRVKRPDGSVVVGESPDFVLGTAAPAITSGTVEFVNFGDVSSKTGTELEQAAITAQVTQFIRIEDGAWDPRPGHEGDYYFVTTGAISGTASSWRPSRLWHVRFTDIGNPEAGGTIDMVLTNQFFLGAGSAATADDDPSYQMFDNIAIDGLGRIVLLEDVGNNARLGRVYVYGIDTKQLVQVARFDPARFSGTPATNPNVLTNDEETSGVIDASAFFGPGWFLMSVQNHAPSADAELVEGGQLIAMYIDPSIAR